jgi:hypothetical protein
MNIRNGDVWYVWLCRSQEGMPTKAKLAILDLPEVADQIGV